MCTSPFPAQAYFYPKGPRALLFLHGFTSTPQSLLPVAEKLAEAGFTVSLPLLPGHGTSPQDLAAHSAQDWLQAALTAYDQLTEHYSLPAVAGLSLGAALALHVAAHRPVPAVVALAPALYLRDWRLALLPILKYILPWKQSLGNDIKGKLFIEHTYQRYRLKSLQDLLEVMRIVRAELAQITAPLLAIQAQEDHTIPPSCLDDLIHWVHSTSKEKLRLHDSYHVITMDNEYLPVAEKMREFLRRFLGNQGFNQ